MRLKLEWASGFVPDAAAPHQTPLAGKIAVGVVRFDPADVAADLEEAVDHLVETGAIGSAQTNGLRNKLRTAQRQMERGNVSAARALIAALINQLEGMFARAFSRSPQRIRCSPPRGHYWPTSAGDQGARRRYAAASLRGNPRRANAGPFARPLSLHYRAHDPHP